MATIIDVARMAGVSQGTASNVLNGKGNVSSEKIKAVEEAEAEVHCMQGMREEQKEKCTVCKA